MLPRISFGIIVLNGEPFTRYCLRALYPYAHEIIVVEGACRDAAGIATADGHSIDGTLDSLRRFASEEDSEGKVRIVTRDGFWSEKNEQSQAYASIATGDYLWQVDIDEFYRHEDMVAVLEMLRSDPAITAVSFKQITFWGGFDYTVDGWYLRAGAEIYHRLFKWGPGYRYASHRPPTVQDAAGRDLRQIRYFDGYRLARDGIHMYHYSLVFPKQVHEKCNYYSRAKWAQREGAERWAEEVFQKLAQPYRVHNVYEYPSWLQHFRGHHPSAILQLKDDIESGRLEISTRRTDDIEDLLHSRRYQIGAAMLRFSQPLVSLWHRTGRRAYRRARTLTHRLVQPPS